MNDRLRRRDIISGSEAPFDAAELSHQHVGPIALPVSLLSPPPILPAVGAHLC